MRDPDREGHPILAGTLALVAVAVVVGGLIGGGALAASRVLGLDGQATAARDSATSDQTLYVPRPTKTVPDDNSYITLSPNPSDSSVATSEPSTPSAPPTSAATRKPPVRAINLTSGETAVSVMQDIDLTGTYPGGEGAVLQVQQFSSGQWTDFPVTMSVSNEQFATYIQTGQTGPNRLRVIDTDSGTKSNVVRVMVG